MLELYKLGNLVTVSQKTQRILLSLGFENMLQVKNNIELVNKNHKISMYAIGEINDFLSPFN